LAVDYPARILLAVGERQAVKGRARGGIGSQGAGERLGYVDLAGSRVQLDRHVDGVPSLDTSRFPHLAINPEQKLAAHPGHGRTPAVPVHRCGDGKALRALADGGHLLVIEDDCGGGTARRASS